MKSNYWILFLSLLAMACNTQKIKQPASKTLQLSPADSLTLALTKMQLDGQINGFGVALVDATGVKYEGGFGLANRATNTKYSIHTIQNIASISKTLIGISLMKAQELGYLTLDDPISKHLHFEVRNPRFPETVITIRHLATHTSSIKDGDIYDKKTYVLADIPNVPKATLEMKPSYFNDPKAKRPLDQFLESMLAPNGEMYSKKNYTKEKPGDRFEYSNTGAALAGLIIARASGMSFDDFTKTHILDPLNMQGSAWSLDDIDINRHTRLYNDKTTVIPYYSLNTYPDGGLLTSTHNLSLYLHELIKGYIGKGTLLKPASYQELFTRQLSADKFKERDEERFYNDEYNHGIFMGFSATGQIGHTGGDPGVATFMFFDSARHVGQILMVNTDINDKKGVDQFIGIWKKVQEYESKLRAK